MNLDFMPSPAPEHPGLFIRDPYHYSDAMLMIPPGSVQCLECFDGAIPRSTCARHWRASPASCR